MENGVLFEWYGCGRRKTEDRSRKEFIIHHSVFDITFSELTHFVSSVRYS